MALEPKLLSGQTTTTSVASGEKLVKVDGNGNVTLITPDNLKAAMLAGLNLNAIEDGIFIMYHRASDNYPLMVKPHKWTALQSGGEVADGVVVAEGGKLLVVAPTEGVSLLWSSEAVSGGGVTTSDRVTTYNDFAGKTNTAAQITKTQCQGASYAPGFCAAYNHGGLAAGKWWLPGAGEMMMIYANMLKINYALSLISGATQLVEDAYWTSTELSSTYAWLLYLNGGLYYWSTKASYRYRVRPVSAFIG